MTDADRKLLTEYLGEYWHEDLSSIYHPQRCSCGREYGEDMPSIYLREHIELANRSFSTPDDLCAVYSKMVERGEWEKFFDELYSKWWATHLTTAPAEDFAAYLFCLAAPDQIPERMAMAAEWVRTHDRP